MLDHLLDEHAFDGLVAGAHVAGAESMEGQDCDDQRDGDEGGGRWNSGGHLILSHRNTSVIAILSRCTILSHQPRCARNILRLAIREGS